MDTELHIYSLISSAKQGIEDISILIDEQLANSLEKTAIIRNLQGKIIVLENEILRLNRENSDLRSGINYYQGYNCNR